MAWSIDDIDLMIPPIAGGGSRSDGYTPVLLLLHPVHGGFAVIYLADLVVFAGVEKDAFCGGCLSGINMCHDADVAHILKRHKISNYMFRSFSWSTTPPATSFF